MPAIAALIRLARNPAKTAFRPNLAISLLRSGAMPPSPPKRIPIEEKLAKPQSAKVIIAWLLSLKFSICSVKAAYAIN